jgi:hypothetical protein
MSVESGYGRMMDLYVPVVNDSVPVTESVSQSTSQCVHNVVTLYATGIRGSVVTEALRYKPEDCGFEAP